MEVPTSKKFWALLGQVMRYAVDQDDTYEIVVEPTNYPPITPAVFLDKLYVKRSGDTYETQLAHHLETARPLVAVASHRGSGKTSALYAASRLLTKPKSGNKLLVEILDFRQIWETYQLRRAGRDAFEAISSSLEKELRRRFFPSTTSTTKLIAWLLAGEKDRKSSLNTSCLGSLFNTSIKALTEARIPEAPRAKRFKALHEYFLTHHPEYQRYLTEVLKELRVQHTVLAKHSLSDATRIILVYDNVDKLPPEQQRVFVEVANDHQNVMASFASSCVALRAENLHGGLDGAERGASPIHVVLPDDQLYTSLLLPELERKHIQEILRRRHQFAYELFEKHEPTARAAAPNDVIHRLIARQFQETPIHRLTNENIRAIGQMYVGFMRYLYKLDERHYIDLTSIEKDQNHANTLFYLWLRNHGPLADIRLYDVVRISDDIEDAEFKDAASVHHFILSAILNLTRLVGGKQQSPSFQQVIERLQLLGFEPDQVSEAVVTMLSVNDDESPKTIEFHLSQSPSISNIQDFYDRPIRLTYLGRVLVTDIFSKVGYVWGLAHEHSVDKGKVDPDEAYLNMAPLQRVEILYRYVKDLALAHLRLLARLQSTWGASQTKDWFTTYKRYFSYQNRVQVERILSSAARFYQNELTTRKLPNVFDSLSAAYGTASTQAAAGTPFHKTFVNNLEEAETAIFKEL